jgi:DNA-binding ferritin-like protein
MDYKTIRIYKETFETLDKLCERYGSSKTELVESMSSYFLKTNIDPKDPTNITKEVLKLKGQLISFIRTQEKNKLNPLIQKQDALINKFMNHLEEETVTRKFMMELAQAIVDKLKEK